jgi:hypothetical protein
VLEKMNKIMSDNAQHGQEEIHSKVLRAGRRTYFFDVRSTKADDYYLTITESKKHTGENGNIFYKKHKIYLYKEDFEQFKELLDEATNFIIDEKGEEVISEKHEPDYHKKHTEKVDLENETQGENHSEGRAEEYTDVNFDDI